MGGEPIHILHVDDEPGFADMTASFLKREDDRVVVETELNVTDAIDTLATTSVDCVISDYDMAGRDGIDFLKAVREDYPDLPFILFTGKGSEEVASDAFTAGASDYLRKQTGTDQFEVLVNRIRTLVSAREANRQAESRRHRLEQTLKTVPACVVRIDPDGEFVFVNDRAEEVLGMAPSEVTTRTYNDPAWNIRDLDGDPIPDEELPFRRVLDSGEPVHGCRHSIEWPDGTRKILHVNGAPIFGDTGTIESTLFALTDITESTQRELELARLKDRYEAFANHSEDILTVIDREGVIQYESPAIECVLGYTPDELVGELAFDYVHPDDVERITDAFSEVVESPDVSMKRVEYRFRHADGSWVWIESVGSNRTDSAIDGYVISSRDVTGRKEREAEIGLERERLWAIFETVPFPIAHVRLVDGSNIVENLNPAFAEVFGFDTEDLKGRCLNEVIVPNDRIADARQIDESVSETNFMEREVTRETVDGRRDFLFRARELDFEPERPGREAIGVYIDITERNEREKKIQEQNERLDQFAGVVSHDLRNPLNIARGYVDFAREDADIAHLDTVDMALERMGTLIDDLLTLAREGEETGDRDSVDIAGFAENAWNLVETRDATLSADTNIRIRADRRRLRQLLDNLFRNAVEHGGNDVVVTLGDTDDGFYVEDDGAGFAEAELEAMSEFDGIGQFPVNGLGLQIVEMVADAHDWTVTVGRSPTGGARFTISGVTVEDPPESAPDTQEQVSLE